MKWFQFSLRRLVLVVFFCCLGLGFTKAAFAEAASETRTQIVLRFACSILAAAAFGTAVGTIMRSAYNGFALGVFVAFLLYLLAFCGLVIDFHHLP